MWLIDQLAERKIQEARRRGELDDLPGAGRPVVLDDDRFVPEALRAGYRLLKNAGFLPPELTLRREIASVEALLAQATEPAARDRAGRRLSCLRAALQARGGDLRVEAAYAEALHRRLDRPER